MGESDLMRHDWDLHDDYDTEPGLSDLQPEQLFYEPEEDIDHDESAEALQECAADATPDDRWQGGLESVQESHQDRSTRTQTPGPAAVCPMCGKPEVFEHPDGQLRHCFGCGENTTAVVPRGVKEVVADILRASHRYMLTSSVRWAVLVEERGLHPQVLVDSAMGIVPPDLDVTQLFLPKLEKAHTEQARVLAAPRKVGRPTKKEQEAIDDAMAAVERLNQTRDELAAFFDGRTEWLIFAYTDATHGLVRIRLWSPETGEMVEKSFDSASGVFNHTLFPPGQCATSLTDLQRQSIIVATEMDLLQLQSLGARLAEREGLKPEAGYLKAAAVGDDNVDAAAVRALGQLLLVIRNGGNPGAATRMVDAIRRELNLFAVTVPDSRTLHDWLRGYSNELTAQKALLDLSATRTFVARPYDAVQVEIDGWRSLEEREVKKFKADRWAAATLVRDITQRGQLFYDGREAYVFDSESKELFPVERDNVDTQLFLTQYGIAPTDGFLKHALSAIRVEAQGLGVKTKVYSLSHYDAKTNRLYLFDQHRYVYRISTSAVERVDNGTDNVLFTRNPKWEAFELVTSPGERSPIASTLLSSFRLRGQTLSRQEQEMLFGSWIHSMFFPELFPTRPLVAMIGVKGSGKTSLLRHLGQLLFGSQFDVMQLTQDARDFDAAVTTDAFVAVDNADTDLGWLPDRLAIVATGGTIKRRRLYTTDDMVEYPVTAFLGITSRTLHFVREDVADRLLLFGVERMEKFTAEGDLRRKLARERNLLMSALVAELQSVLAALELTRDKQHDVSFRMADFGQFVLKVAEANDRLPEAESMLRRLANEQLALSIQDDPVIELLDIWLRSPANLGRELTTGDLFHQLKMQAGLLHPPREFEIKSVIAFGRKLQELKGTLSDLFGASERAGRAGTRWWTFNPATPTATESVEVPLEFSEEDRKAYMEWARKSMN